MSQEYEQSSLHIDIEGTHRPKISIYAIIVAMSLQFEIKQSHGLINRLMHPPSEPFFYRLSFRLELLLACGHLYSVVSSACLAIGEGESEEIEALPCTLEPPERKNLDLY